MTAATMLPEEARSMSPDPACQNPGTCAVHPLIEQNVTSMRDTFDRFVAQEGAEHARLRESLLRQAEQFHQQLLEVATLAAQAKGATAAAEDPHPHPLQRAEDYEQRVVLQLSRKDLWKFLAGTAVVLMLLIGLALIAGRDGLDLWGKAAAPVIPGAAK
jgi:hypothetical protein